MSWGSDEEVERRNRIRLSLWAYAYEVKDDPLVSDAEFDELAQRIDLSIRTGQAVFDNFFWNEFSPSTGMWVLKHPDQRGLEAIYERHKQGYPQPC